MSRSQLVNIHLFADDSNIEAARKSPSQFSRWREAAMRFTLGEQADAFVDAFVIDRCPVVVILSL